MSSPSPGPNLTGAQAAAVAAAAGILGGPRRVSTGFMAPLGMGVPGSVGTSHSRSSPTPGGQPSPNSFLAGLSSRLISRTQGFPHPMRPVGGGGPGGLPDIFDTAGVGGPIGMSGMSGAPGSTIMASFRASHNHPNFGIPTSSGPGVGPGGGAFINDINEFPSLGGSGGGSGLIGGGAPGSNRPNYVGMVKDQPPVNEYNKQPFEISNEDFPALPGSLNLRDAVQENMSQVSGPGLGSFRSPIQPLVGPDGSGDGSAIGLGSKSAKGRGIQTTKEGRVTNIPPGMVTDQFGIIGLLTFIRAAEYDQNLVSLALGTDLTTLKLDLNSSDNLYSAFPGPWSDLPLRPHEIDYPVPSEYLIYNQIRDKLAPIKLSRYGDDTLFYFFYMFLNDLVQVAAASELYARDWRYHKDEKVWITRAPGMPPLEKTQTYERGTYYFFDHVNWRRVAKEFHLDYDRLENRPAAAALNHAANSAGSANNPLMAS